MVQEMQHGLKRSHESDDEGYEGYDHTKKRSKFSHSDHLSRLSDEILLRTLYFLPTSDVVLCARLSRRLRSLASDPQLWKALFYDRFVQPRSFRIPGIRQVSDLEKAQIHAARRAKWLQEENNTENGRKTDWKRRYRIRHNWSNGSAQVKECQIADTVSKPPILLRLRGNLVIVADSSKGIQVVLMSRETRILATHKLGTSPPISLAVDTSQEDPSTCDLTLGFSDGSFSIYTFIESEGRLLLRFAHPAPGRALSLDNSNIAIAHCSPFLLTLNAAKTLSLYRLDEKLLDVRHPQIDPPLLLSSVKSGTAARPFCLSLRKSILGYIASIAYPISNLTQDWSVGLQEFQLGSDGSMIKSRMASSYPAITRPALYFLRGTQQVQDGHLITSVSYSHPYLLTSHLDNTLSLHMITSNADELTVGSRQQLLGHTSAISGAHVSNRGRAVSVNRMGNDVRVWDLESYIPSDRKPPWYHSVQIQQRIPNFRNIPNLSSLPRIGHNESDATEIKAHGWVSFDEEKVVFLRGENDGPQALVTYDFT